MLVYLVLFPNLSQLDTNFARLFSHCIKLGFVKPAVTLPEEQMGSITTGCYFLLLVRMLSAEISLVLHQYPSNKPAALNEYSCLCVHSRILLNILVCLGLFVVLSKFGAVLTAP